MQNFWENLDGLVPTLQKAWGVPGLGIAIVKDDETVYHRGFGVCAIGGTERIDEHTIFAVGSCTKAFTATAIGLLVQEDLLKWDDPVTKYLPRFQLYDAAATRELTVRDLLCHRCGLATFSGDFMGYGSAYEPEEALERARFIPPAFPLRSAYGYSNLMYTAAGLIIQELIGLSWGDFIQQRLLQPLGMQRTTTRVQDLEGMKNIAQPHASHGDQVIQLPYANLKAHAASGAINSTAWDMALWLRFQLADGSANGLQLVEPAILEETRTPHTLMKIDAENRKLIPRRHFSAYGLGWQLSDYAGRLVVQHTGGVDGMLSLAAFLPEEQLGVVILTNRLPGSFFQVLFMTILDSALGIEATDWQNAFIEQDRVKAARKTQLQEKLEKERIRGAQPGKDLNCYTGTYSNPIYGRATIELEGDRLVLLPGAHPSMKGPLEHWNADIFNCVWSNPVFEESFIQFSIGLDGMAETMRFKVAEFIDPLEYIFIREK